jgi:YggT family protein
MLNPIAFILYQVLELYKWIVLAAVIASWLAAFNVVNPHNNTVRAVLRVLFALTEPAFRQVRRVIPPMGGLDLSPLVVFFIIIGLQYAIYWPPLLVYGF